MSRRSHPSFTWTETIRWRHSLSLGEMELFLREVQPFAWKTAVSLGRDHFEFTDQRNMAGKGGRSHTCIPKVGRVVVLERKEV